ncbi:MAG: hypothetical protein H0V92_08425 [Pseudonocardiales bacterium]|nr:hypothetical protein [Pseudonocardiales bacterium]
MRRLSIGVIIPSPTKPLKPSMTTDVYYGRKAASTGAAVALESFDRV